MENDEPACGSICCVIGAASMDKIFAFSGLSHTYQYDEERKVWDLEVTLNGDAVPYYDARIGDLLGLNESDYQNLVNPFGYNREIVTPPDVVQRIDELIQKYQTPEPLGEIGAKHLEAVS